MTNANMSIILDVLRTIMKDQVTDLDDHRAPGAHAEDRADRILGFSSS